MKAVTAKMLVSLIGILVATPFFAVALIVGARAVAVSQGTQDDLILAALALAGALASVVNGMGGRTKQDRPAANKPNEARANGLTSGASTIHLGY
jgi:Na+/proline symporter